MTQREQLIKLIETGNDIATEKILSHAHQIVKEKHRYDSAKDRLVSHQELVADYLLNNGVNVLPCKVGDTVYYIKSMFSFMTTPKSEKVHTIIITQNGMTFKTESRAFNLKAINDTVFLTLAKAEKALKEGKENND